MNGQPGAKTSVRAEERDVGSTVLDRLFAPAEAEHPSASGFRLITEGPEAFDVRAWSARVSGRTLDVQTYVWKADRSGMTLAFLLLQAADRGVRVRLLVDDLDGRAKNAGFAGLEAHPNVEVRIFNPFETRSGLVTKMLEAVGRFPRLNRRMHNKSWIADGRLALAGGRNLGDKYFGADDEAHFVDLDMAMVGRVVEEVTASFEQYWNASVVRSMAELDREEVTDETLAAIRGFLEDQVGTQDGAEADDAEASVDLETLFGPSTAFAWTDDWTFVSDDPAKVEADEPESSDSPVLELLLAAMRPAGESLSVISPYFVPGATTLELLRSIAGRGEEVRVLTNSLAANDVAAVHGGYMRHRKPLLEAGVGLWELKPEAAGGPGRGPSRSTPATLHTKALVVDRQRLFVGSYNLDHRSRFLNCEQGVFITSPELAEQLESVFESRIQGAHAWSVSLHQGALRWTDGEEVVKGEPGASTLRRLNAWLAYLLPIDAQL